METSKPVPVPTGLGAKARRYWKRLLEDMEFSPAELVELEDICRLTDVCEKALAEVKEHGVTIADERGSRKVNPAVNVYHRSAALRLRKAARLGLLDDLPAVKPAPGVMGRKRA